MSRFARRTGVSSPTTPIGTLVGVQLSRAHEKTD
jgi:hypothetical protein